MVGQGSRVGHLSLTAAPSGQVVSAEGRFSGDCPVKGERGSDRNLDIWAMNRNSLNKQRPYCILLSYNLQRSLQRLPAQRSERVAAVSSIPGQLQRPFSLSLQITFVPADSEFLSPKALSLMENKLLEVKR